MLRVFFLICLSVSLTACTTFSNNKKEAEEEAKRKVSTAKINTQLGLAYLEQQNLQRAKRKLMLALQQAPNIPEPWYSMAYFFETTGEKNVAKEYYLKAISLAPQRGDTHNNYGTFLCRSKHYQASIKEFMLAVKDVSYLEPASAYENAGVCALKIPNQKLAYHYFQQALTQDPSRAVSLYHLSALDYQRKHYNAANTKLVQFAAISQHTPETLALRDKIAQKIAQQHAALLNNKLKLIRHKQLHAQKKMHNSHSLANKKRKKVPHLVRNGKKSHLRQVAIGKQGLNPHGNV